MDKVIVKAKKEMWEDSEDSEDYKHQLEKEIKAGEDEVIKEQEEEEKQLAGFDDINNFIKSMCVDMQDKNPNIHNQLGGLIKKLEEQSNIVQKGIKGKGKKEKIIGKRLSSLTEEEIKKYPTKQGKYTKKDIAERLKNFSKISNEEIFDIAKKGIWIRYFKIDEDGSKLFRTGGFITNIDSEKRYITLISHHSNQSFTWNMQLETTHSIYMHTKNVKTYRLKQMDKKYNMLTGTSCMLNKWFVFDISMVTKMQIDNRGVIYVIYDKKENKLYSPIRKQTNVKLLESLNIKEEDFKQQLLLGLKKQLENPLHDSYIVAILNKIDLPKVKKMKSRIKEYT
jgi:hypothetical protein